MRELFEPVAERPQRRAWTPIAVLVLGIFSIALLLWTRSASEQRRAQDLAVERALNQLEVAAVTSHLWFEEFVAGDPEVDLKQEVFRNQDLALIMVRLILQGGESENGMVLEALRDPGLRRQAEDLEARLDEFRDLALERYRHPDVGGIGSDLDQTYDASFRQVMSQAKTLRLDIYAREERARRRSDLFQLVIIAAWVAIVGSAAIGLWNTERRSRRAEEAVRASQRWLATTLNSIGDAVVTTDLHGAIFFMNPEAEKMTGWPLEEASGKAIKTVFRIAREDGGQIENPVAAVLRTDEAVGMTNHTVMANRQRNACYGIDESAAPIRDDQGELLGVVLVFRDVSERRQTEKALRQRETELLHSRKMEAVGRMAGGIAHDVNNYLGAIRGYCETAMMKAETGKALANRMTLAIETAEKVSALIRQLLAFSRRQPVQPEVVDLNRVAAGMELLMERLLGEDLALTTRLNPKLWSIEIDPSQVEQTLINLLVNARDAMPTGGSIHVATDNMEIGNGGLAGHPTVEPGRYVVLTVKDTGSGIAPEVREKIFDPFFTTKAESGSSGLGLATVYGIASQNGGFVTVESEVGAGSRFDVYLPASDRPAVPPLAADSAPVATVGSARILLVEDHDGMRASTKGYLEIMGHEVQVATDGESALAALAADPEPFDLLITDVIMPGMSGKDLFERVRERYGAVRCLFISGYTANVMLRHGLSRDRVHFLPKPFGFESLARKIGEVLRAPVGPPEPH